MSANEIIVSAPGKVILHGEHAVVYGKSAIAASLNLRSYLRLLPAEDEQVCVNLPAVNLHHTWKVNELSQLKLLNTDVNIKDPEWPSEDTIQSINKFINKDKDSSDPVDLAMVAFLYLYSSLCTENSPPAFSLKLVSELPVGAGLGSSASFSVCLATALLLHQKYITAAEDGHLDPNDLDLVNKWAFQGERIIHGNPSGIDNSVATFGGAIKFQKGQITKLDRIPNMKILLTSTHVPRSTKVLVAGVKEKSEKYPGILRPVMEAMEAVSEKCQDIYKEMTDDHTDQISHYAALEELIDINQHLLQVLGVSHMTLDRICHVTSKYSLHSKLTGAGGGGCAFTLLTPSTDKVCIESVKKELEPDGFSCWQTDIGGAGVTVHSEVPQCLL